MNATAKTKVIHLEYFAALRSKRGLSKEQVSTVASTPTELYAELSLAHGFTLPEKEMRVAVNDEFADWQHSLRDGDRVVFIPPVSGG